MMVMVEMGKKTHR